MKRRKLDKREALRRARLGDLQRLFQSRYGTRGLPDDDAGRGDLFELVMVTSLAPAAHEKKGLCIIELWAPWMPRGEAEALVNHVWGLDLYERTPTARTLGNRLRMTNAERERLRLWTIKPFDMTDEQLVEQSKARQRARRERKRRDKGVRSRAAYLVEMKAKPKPWLGEGIDRATWYRRRAKAVRLGRVETIVGKDRNNLVALRVVESQRGYHGGELVERPRIVATEAVQMASEGSSESALRHDLVAPESSGKVPTEIDPAWAARERAFGGWGTNAKRKPWTKPTILSDEPRDFAAFPGEVGAAA
jgi:hypothetical protein